MTSSQIGTLKRSGVVLKQMCAFLKGKFIGPTGAAQWRRVDRGTARSAGSIPRQEGICQGGRLDPRSPQGVCRRQLTTHVSLSHQEELLCKILNYGFKNVSG